MGGSENFRPKLFSAVATMLRTENCRSKVVVDGAESAEYTVARVRAQLAEARAGHDYIKPVEKAPKKKFFGRSK